MAQGINELIDFAVNGHRRDRLRVIERLQQLEDGRVRHESKDQSGQWVDITQDLISEYRDEVKMHEQMIAAYEKMRST